MTQPTDRTEQDLRKQLRAYLSHAQVNEQKMRRMQSQELRFISASKLTDLLDEILVDYINFYQLDFISLLLIDPDYEIRRIMERLAVDENHYPHLLFSESDAELAELFDHQGTPRLGSYSAEKHASLFPTQTKTPASVAIIPLIRSNRIIGSLSLGSNDASRFIHGSATDFLQRLSAILAVCIENALNMEKLKLLGLLDPLTGIYNRRYFDERTREEYNRAMRQQQSISCLFIDIDHFKQFNDRYGHAVGDLVLQSVAQVIRFQMRKSDVLCRYGGEEFAVLLSNTAKTMALEIAERIRQLIEQRSLSVAATAEALHVTVSIGCSSLEEFTRHSIEQGIHDLLDSADRALYHAKEQGRNRVSFSPCQSVVKAQ